MTTPQNVWTWADERRVMLKLKPLDLAKYIETVEQRTHTFEGEPMTEEWKKQFEKQVTLVRQQRHLRMVPR